jgi:protein phosphatase
LTQSLDTKIRDLSQCDPDFGGMGSTLVLTLIRNRTVWWFHIGDSRLYLFRNARIIQITEDQTLDRFLIKENILAPEDAPFHYSRHVMDQFVGCGFCRAASGSFSIGPGDLLILTSDGVYRHLSAPLLAAVLDEAETPAAKCREIVARVLTNGGKDNLTIMIYHQK